MDKLGQEVMVRKVVATGGLSQAALLLFCLSAEGRPGNACFLALAVASGFENRDMPV